MVPVNFGTPLHWKEIHDVVLVGLGGGRLAGAPGFLQLEQPHP